MEFKCNCGDKLIYCSKNKLVCNYCKSLYRLDSNKITYIGGHLKALEVNDERLCDILIDPNSYCNKIISCDDCDEKLVCINSESVSKVKCDGSCDSCEPSIKIKCKSCSSKCVSCKLKTQCCNCDNICIYCDSRHECLCGSDNNYCLSCKDKGSCDYCKGNCLECELLGNCSKCGLDDCRLCPEFDRCKLKSKYCSDSDICDDCKNTKCSSSKFFICDKPDCIDCGKEYKKCEVGVLRKKSTLGGKISILFD